MKTSLRKHHIGALLVIEFYFPDLNLRNEKNGKIREMGSKILLSTSRILLPWFPNLRNSLRFDDFHDSASVSRNARASASAHLRPPFSSLSRLIVNLIRARKFLYRRPGVVTVITPNSAHLPRSICVLVGVEQGKKETYKFLLQSSSTRTE